MAAPLETRECEDIFARALADARTPPYLLVAISWNLACFLKKEPPYAVGFDHRFRISHCQRISKTALSEQKGKDAKKFIADNWQTKEAAGWRRRRFELDNMFMSQALGTTAGKGGGGASLPCHICAVCSANDSVFVPNGRKKVGGIVQSYGQKSTHTRLQAHKTAVAEKLKAPVAKGPVSIQKDQIGAKGKGQKGPMKRPREAVPAGAAAAAAAAAVGAAAATAAGAAAAFVELNPPRVDQIFSPYVSMECMSRLTVRTEAKPSKRYLNRGAFLFLEQKVEVLREQQITAEMIEDKIEYWKLGWAYVRSLINTGDELVEGYIIL